MEAIAKTEVPTVIVFVFHDVKDIDDAGRIYAVMDIHTKRSWADSLKAMDRMDIVPNAGRVLSAVGVIERNFEQFRWKVGSRIESRIERIDHLNDYKDAADLFATAIAGGMKDAKEIAWLAPITAVALFTIRYQATVASEFWERFAKDEGLIRGDPERALLGYCRNNRAYLSGARQQVAMTARAAALAWNARFKDAELEVVKPSSVRKFIILGTPLDHGIPGEE
jgi:hypothetical protein